MNEREYGSKCKMMQDCMREIFKEEEQVQKGDSVFELLQRKIRCQKPDCPNSHKYGRSPELPINIAKDCPNAKISKGCAGYRRK